MARRGPPGMERAKGSVPMGTHCNVDYFYSYDRDDWHTDERDLEAKTRTELLEKIVRQVRNDFRRFEAIYCDRWGGNPRLVTVTSATVASGLPLSSTNPNRPNEYVFRDAGGTRQKGNVECFYAPTPENLAIMRATIAKRADIDRLNQEIQEDVAKMTRLGWHPNGLVDEEPESASTPVVRTRP